MNRIVIAASTMGLLLVTTGCAHNALRADNAVRVGNFFGDYGVCGHGNNVTIQSRSRLNKISFMGNNNTVTVEQGALVSHVEFWGRNNTVSIPESLMVRTTEVGEGNRIIRRQLAWDLEPEPEAGYPAETASTPSWREMLTPVEEEPLSTPPAEVPKEEAPEYVPETEPEEEPQQLEREYEK